MKRFPYTIAYVFIALNLMASSCFNGDDGVSPANYNEKLKGNYLINQVGQNSNGVYTAQVEINSDGNGAGTYNVTRHSQGNTTVSPQAFTYSVASDRTFIVNNGIGEDHGIISNDGSMFIIVDAQTTATDTDGEIIFSIGLSKDCSVAPTISGDYQIGQIAVDYSTTAQLYTSRVDITVDPLTTNTFAIVEHSLGHTGSGDFTISVQPDCTITVNNGLGDDFGIASSDGSLFALVDAVEVEPSGDNSILLAVGIEKSAGMDNSLLVGDYWLGQLAQDTTVVAQEYASQVNVNSQGDGTASADIARHSLGNTASNISLTYTVNSDGSYVVNNGGGDDFGVISANGETFFAVDANPVDGDNEIVFAVGMRK